MVGGVHREDQRVIAGPVFRIASHPGLYQAPFSPISYSILSFRYSLAGIQALFFISLNLPMTLTGSVSPAAFLREWMDVIRI
jgi:hypothetical protein